MQFEIIWPEYRWVDEAKIRLWLSDAVANGEISEEYANDLNNPEEIARELSNIGHITLGRGRK